MDPWSAACDGLQRDMSAYLAGAYRVGGGGGGGGCGGVGDPGRVGDVRMLMWRHGPGGERQSLFDRRVHSLVIGRVPLLGDLLNGTAVWPASALPAGSPPRAQRSREDNARRLELCLDPVFPFTPDGLCVTADDASTACGLFMEIAYDSYALERSRHDAMRLVFCLYELAAYTRCATLQSALEVLLVEYTHRQLEGSAASCGRESSISAASSSSAAAAASDGEVGSDGEEFDPFFFGQAGSSCDGDSGGSGDSPGDAEHAAEVRASLAAFVDAHPEASVVSAYATRLAAAYGTPAGAAHQIKFGVRADIVASDRPVGTQPVWMVYGEVAHRDTMVMRIFFDRLGRRFLMECADAERRPRHITVVTPWETARLAFFEEKRDDRAAQAASAATAWTAATGTLGAARMAETKRVAFSAPPWNGMCICVLG